MIRSRAALAIAILLAVLLPLTLVAQSDAPAPPQQGQPMGEHHGHMGPMGPPPDPQAHLDHLSRMLNLTDDQKTKIKPIFDNTETQAQSIRKDASLSPQDRHTKMRALHESSMSQVRALLTPEQQAKFDEMKKHEGMGRGHGMGHGYGMGKPDSQKSQPQ